MIVVTGATGQLGNLIVKALAGRMPAGRVGASCRDPAKAADLAALGVRVRRGDYEEPASLADAFEGATQVLLISSNVAAKGGDPLPQHRNAIGAAKAAGARRIVYTSHMAASPTAEFPPMHAHAATEDMLAASGVAWTSLRNGFYASSALQFMGDALQTGTLEAPADGLVAWTTHEDLAAAAAIILTDEGKYDGPTPPLVGSQELDLAGVATLASELAGKPIERRVITDEQFREKMAARGAPPRMADLVLRFYAGARNGRFASDDPTLAQLLGRPTMTMRDVLSARA